MIDVLVAVGIVAAVVIAAILGYAALDLRRDT